MRRLPVIVTGMLALAGCLVLFYFKPDFLEPISRQATDLLARSISQPPQSNLVWIVDIDEASLRQAGQWPWSRKRLAQLHQEILQRGASVIAYDILFPEPDRTSPETALALWRSELGADIDLRGLPAEYTDFDNVFAEAVAQGKTILACYMELSQGPVDRPPAHDLYRGHFVETEPSYRSILPQARRVITSLPLLEQSAEASAFFNTRGDADNIVRRTPLLFAVGSTRLYPAFSLEALRLYRGENTFTIRYDEAIHGVADIRLRNFIIPTDEHGQLTLNFRSTPFPHISAASLLLGQAPPHLFSNRIVLVGTSAAGLRDLVATPMAPEVPGVEIHATALDNMIAGDMLYEPRWLKLARLGVILLWGALMIPVFHITRSWIGFIAALASLAVAFFLCEWLMTAHHVVASPVELGASLALIYTLMTLIKFWNEERERHHIRTMFGTMVSSDVMLFLETHPENFSLMGRREEASIFVSDIADFSGMAEALSPEALSHLMNRYLTPMSDIIMRWGGYVDKFDGDAIMSVWGVPRLIPDHAAKACLAALEQIEALEHLRPTLLKEFGYALRIRVGINTGLVTAGNMGSSRRFQYTVLGDPVNQAFRHEDICRFYGVSAIIGEPTFLQARDVIEARRLGEARLKGKKLLTPLYEIVGHKGQISESMRNVIAWYEEADALCQRREWALAQSALEKALGLRPEDGPSRFLLDRMEKHLRHHAAFDLEPFCAP